MAQELVIEIPLSRSQTGLTLSAQLYDNAGAATGGAITTGFTEFGNGAYQWSYAAFSDAYAAAGGSVVFSAAGVRKAHLAVNPADFGLVDAASATSIATAVWAAGTRTLTSFGTLVADVATAVWAAGTRTLTVALALTPADLLAIAAAVWANATRTLTMSAAAIAAAVAGTSITLRRGDTNTVSLTGLGDISDRTKLWFTVKESEADADTASILQIIEGTGLIYLNGAAATAGQGALVVTNPVTGAVTITVAAAAAAQLAVEGRLYWDVQVLRSGGTVQTIAEGALRVVRDATRVTS